MELPLISYITVDRFRNEGSPEVPSAYLYPSQSVNPLCSSFLFYNCNSEAYLLALTLRIFGLFFSVGSTLFIAFMSAKSLVLRGCETTALILSIMSWAMYRRSNQSLVFSMRR